MGELLEAYFRDGWHLRDERNRGASLMKKTGVVDDLNIHTLEEINHTLTIRNFWRPKD